MEKNGVRFPSDVIDAIRRQSGLSIERLAHQVGCTSGAIVRWRRRQALTLDAVVTLLVYCVVNDLPAAKTLARYLQQACGKAVVVTVGRKTK